MNELLVPARDGGYAVGSFTFWSLDSAQAVVQAAEELDMPVILQTGPLEIDYAGIDNLAEIARMAAEGSSVKVALHLDHGDTLDLAEAAVKAGFTSVMIDVSALPYEENVDITRRAVEIAAPRGITVESELGRLVGSEAGTTYAEEDAVQTDPEEAARFVEETGIDALAVAIGTAHGFYKSEPRLNLERLSKIAEMVSIPLVLHGGSGTPDDQLLAAIDLGIAKVNICTEFLAAFGGAYRSVQDEPGFKYSIPSFIGKGREAGRELALKKMKLFAGDRPDDTAES